jgi:hypothetical protein
MGRLTSWFEGPKNKGILFSNAKEIIIKKKKR